MAKVKVFVYGRRRRRRQGYDTSGELKIDCHAMSSIALRYKIAFCCLPLEKFLKCLKKWPFYYINCIQSIVYQQYLFTFGNTESLHYIPTFWNAEEIASFPHLLGVVNSDGNFPLLQ